jgi:membrane protease YdiL (CAAX protease family)
MLLAPNQSSSDDQQRTKEQVSRKLQLCLVLAVGFLIPVVSSTSIFLGLWHPVSATPRRFIFRIVFQIAGLLCLYFVLSHQQKRFRDIGFFPAVRLTELGHSVALFFGALFSSAILYLVLKLLVRIYVGHALQSIFNPAWIFGTTFGILPLLYVLLNPFHEELLVRAFLISETEWIYGSTALAVLMSVALQTSYHLYLGLPGALSHIPAFLLFSLYFVRTRRILPVILAHMLLDVSGLALYLRHLH